MSRASGTVKACKVVLIAMLAWAAVALAGERRADYPREQPALIPWPRSVKLAGGDMVLTETSRIVVRDKRLLPLGRVLAGEMALAVGLQLAVAEVDARPGDLVLSLDSALKGEAHRLTIDKLAEIAGASYNGVALGSVTLLQALRRDGDNVVLPRLAIDDGPRLKYCGTMLDVARMPYSIDTLKQCVRVCRLYKIRYLQLHLSDENAWVFPSTAFPKLGINNEAMMGRDKPPVYKLAELKELVAYADARGVTLVPEIEMPGHSGQLRGTYPEIFGYRDEAGKPVVLGVLNMVSDDAFKALDTLIGEVCAVFKSSPFVHIGSDEVSMGGVEKMPEMKAFLAKRKQTSPAVAFNAFIKRMHAIVKKHGKQMIVWEGAPLDPDAPAKDLICMPWVGGTGAAAHFVGRGYRVINAPWGTKEPYFDPYLVNGAQLKKDERLLFGAASLLWEAPQDRAVPYLRWTAALRNEPTYNPEARRGHADFLRRAQVADARLDRLLHGFTLEMQGTLDPLANMRSDPIFAREVKLSLAAADKRAQVRYTLDGSEPTERSPLFSAPMRLSKPATVKARLFGVAADSLSTYSRTFSQAPALKHDGIGAKVAISPNRPGYFGPGAKGLTDGFLADGDEYSSAGWVGWERDGKPVEIRLDLGKHTAIDSLAVHCLRAQGGVFLPESVAFAVSDDGKAYRDVATVEGKSGFAQRGWFRAAGLKIKSRHVKVTARHGGDWTFIDEVAVNAVPESPTFRHAALGKPVLLKNLPAEPYSAPGVPGLTDGHVARSAEFLNLVWLGIDGKSLDATIDLGKPVAIREVGGRLLQFVRAGVYLPRELEVQVSQDGKEFRKLGSRVVDADPGLAFIRAFTVSGDGERARFVRVVAPPAGQWLFVDEIFVNPERDVD